MGSSETRHVPAGWSPQLAMATYFPAMAALRQTMQIEMRSIEARLAHEEVHGRDTSCLRQALRELRWRLEYTADSAAARATLERVRTIAALAAPPSAFALDEDGSHGPCTEPWFLKLDASVDHMLASDVAESVRPPRFLDRINDPD